MAAKRGRTDPLAKRESLLVDALWVAAEQEGADEALVCAGIHKVIRRWTQMDADGRRVGFIRRYAARIVQVIPDCYIKPYVIPAKAGIQFFRVS